MLSQILIIDDDERLSGMLSEYLGSRGIVVECRNTARSGMAAARALRPDAVILDVMLPDGDGFDVCRALRSESDVPVLMLTARGDEDDRIVGLELGADDYLPKPFNPRELLARIKAIMRRRHPRGDGASQVIRIGQLEIDTAAREVRVAGERRELTSHQFALLRVLAERQGRVQTREQLMEAASGETLEAFDRSIDVHISRIRAAIETDPKRPRYVLTVRSAGYVLSQPALADPERGSEA
jgi:DNA-binding response OmpR family regulator